MFKKLIYLVLAITLLSSCKSIKMAKLLNHGTVQEGEFLNEVPFEYRMGLIILKVTIKGQEYDFLYDTGAPNVISKELANILNIKPYVVNKTGDSQGQKEELEYLLIDKITIGGIDFLETGAAVADLKKSSVIACLKIDGIIGANLMQKAIWQIDYENEVMRISNSISSFDVQDGIHVQFSQKFSGTPIVDINVNGVTEKNVTIDTGSNGDFGLSLNVYKQSREKDSTAKTVFGIGTTTSGLFGVGTADTIYYTAVPKISFGGVELSNQLTNFKGSHATTIGNEFFKNYDVTYDYFEKEMILTNKKDADISSFDSFGFTYFYSDNKLNVSLIIEGSDAHSKGLIRGDQIIHMNGTNYSEMNLDLWCELLNQNLLRISNSLNITILRDGEQITYQLEKKNLLE